MGAAGYEQGLPHRRATTRSRYSGSPNSTEPRDLLAGRPRQVVQCPGRGRSFGYFDRPLIDTQVPVVVVFTGGYGAGGYGALATARTLGRLGVPVYVVAPEDARSPVFASRYWEDEIRCDFAVGRPQLELVSCLREVGARLAKRHGSRPILLTHSDWVAIAIERHSDDLADYFLLPRPTSPIVERLIDKWEMHVLAAHHDIPTPITARPTSRAEVDEFVARTGFPLVVKPANPFLPDPPAKAITR